MNSRRLGTPLGGKELATPAKKSVTSLPTQCFAEAGARPVPMGTYGRRSDWRVLALMGTGPP